MKSFNINFFFVPFILVFFSLFLSPLHASSKEGYIENDSPSSQRKRTISDFDYSQEQGMERQFSSAPTPPKKKMKFTVEPTQSRLTRKAAHAHITRVKYFSSLVLSETPRAQIEELLRLGDESKEINHLMAHAYEKKYLTPQDTLYLKHPGTVIGRNGDSQKAIKDFLEWRSDGAPTQTLVLLYEEFVKQAKLPRNMVVKTFRAHLKNLQKEKVLNEKEMNFIKACTDKTRIEAAKDTAERVLSFLKFRSKQMPPDSLTLLYEQFNDFNTESGERRSITSQSIRRHIQNLTKSGKLSSDIRLFLERCCAYRNNRATGPAQPHRG